MDLERGWWLRKKKGAVAVLGLLGTSLHFVVELRPTTRWMYNKGEIVKDD